ncbi:hypothetical protein BGX38DRAFT_205333 [Terfezia claveryi]|nr:hypothetical protein BGX38DRAFT_205333 [Terfezia claveryi]
MGVFRRYSGGGGHSTEVEVMDVWHALYAISPHPHNTDSPTHTKCDESSSMEEWENPSLSPALCLHGATCGCVTARPSRLVLSNMAYIYYLLKPLRAPGAQAGVRSYIANYRASPMGEATISKNCKPRRVGLVGGMSGLLLFAYSASSNGLFNDTSKGISW